MFMAYPRGFCTNCGYDRGQTIVCKSCGWVDPPTTNNEEAAAEIRRKRLKSKRGYREQKRVYGVAKWLKYYFQRFTCRNKGKHIVIQPEDNAK